MRSLHLVWLGWFLGCGTSPSPSRPPLVRPGIEVLLADSGHLIAGRRLGLLTNHTGVDRAGRRDIDLLRTAHGARLAVLYSPEHGLQGTEDRMGLPDGRDSATGLPIYSLYGGSRTAARAALDSFDVLLIDLQDVGARYFTYIRFAASLLRDATRAGKRVLVLDRPNPVGGVVVQGNVRSAVTDPDSVPVGFLPVAMRHGMTLGELARMADALLAIGADLTVVPAAGWQRPMLYDETGLPWIKPSPNMPDLESALHYPGACLFEGTNLSVGRGTGFAFQVLGAPWLDPEAVIGRLPRAALTGVAVRPDTFTPRAPTDGKHDGVMLRAVRFRVTDRARYDPTRLAVALLVAIRAAHPDSFRFHSATFDRLASGPELRAAVAAGRTAEAIWGDWNDRLAAFRTARERYLLY